MPTKMHRFGLTAVVVVALCSQLFAQQEENGPPGHEKSVDEIFSEIELTVPGFGGLFRDDQGRLTIHVAGEVDLDVVAAAIARSFPALNPVASSIRVVKGDYAFSELVAWRARARSVHSIPGVSLTDVDEASNRVRIGIETEEARDAVMEALLGLGIPSNAVEIEVTGAFFQVATLQDMIRPVVGGIQVTFNCDTQSCFVCTNGFLAIRSGTKGYVTNSHCTINQGGREATLQFQPFPNEKIGKEIIDPNYFTGGLCPAGRQCRFSDSAFVKRVNNTKWTRGLIAHPVSTGSLVIDTVTPTFQVTSETTTPLVGDTVNKVGRTTGWSQGMIDSSCIDVNVSGTSLTILCQEAVDATVDGGDSGSPVFGNPQGPTQDVSLYGILWGGNGAGTQFIFSRLVNIESELGNLKTCDKSSGC